LDGKILAAGAAYNPAVLYSSFAVARYLTEGVPVQPAPGAPVLLAPGNGSNQPQSVALDWSDVAGVASYEVQVDDSSTFAAPLVASQTVTASQATVAALPAQQLWWRVRARNADGVYGSFSPVWSFVAQTSNPPPANVTLTVTATGRRNARLTSSPTGISVTVGNSQSASFAANTSITLRESAGRSVVWSGACSSGGNRVRTCTFTITANAAVTGNVQ
jgi:hypothetical protein